MTVLAGYNAKPESAAALEQAARMASMHGVGLHVVRYFGHDAGDSPTRVRRELDAIDTAEAELTSLAERFEAEGIPTTVELRQGLAGGAAEALLAAAEEREADLIVLGIEPRSKVTKMVLGSVAREVLLAAECPVMTVKAAPEEDDAG